MPSDTSVSVSDADSLGGGIGLGGIAISCDGGAIIGGGWTIGDGIEGTCI
jgi:hypothetical protein